MQPDAPKAGQGRCITGDNALLVPLALALAYVTLIPYPFISGAEVSGVPYLRLIPLSLGAFMLAVLAYRRFTGAPAPLPVMSWAVTLYVAAQAFSSIGSVEGPKSLAKVMFYAVTGIAFFFAAGQLGAKSRRRLLWLTLMLTAIVGAVSAYEFFAGSVPLFQEYYVKNNPYMAQLTGRSLSTIGHPVFVGAIFVLTIPVGFYLSEVEENKSLKVATWFMVALAVAGLFFTFSRGAVAAVIISAVIYYRRRITGKHLAVMLLVLVCAGILASASEKVRAVLETRNPYREYVMDAEHAHRLHAFELNARIMADSPLLGIGVGNYRLQYDRYRQSWDDTRTRYATPDNMYLVTLAETGLLGFGLFLFMLTGIWGSLSRAYRQVGDKLPLAGMAMLAGFMVDIFFFDALYVEPVRIVFWTLMGVACSRPAAPVIDGKSGVQCPAL